MTKRSLAALCCLLWGLAVPALAGDATPLLVRVTDGDGKPVAGATVLRGTVTGPDGHPVAGARVWALTMAEQRASDDALSTPSATTAADGTFSIPDRPREQELNFFVCADGFLQEWSTVYFPEDPVEVRLLPAASIRGRVLGPDGSPVAGAEVSASEVAAIEGCGTRVASPCPSDDPATSDAEGWFHLARLVPAWYTVTAQAPGLTVAEVSPLRAAAGEPVEVEIRFQASATVIGHAPEDEEKSLESWERVVGPDLDSRSVSAEVTTEPRQAEASVELALAPTRQVSGRVVDADGHPIARTEVNFHLEEELSAMTSTRFDGSFSAAVPEGETVASVWSDGFWHKQPVGADRGPVSGLEIRLPRGVRIGGRILGASPWELVIVWLEGPEELVADVDLDGRWSAQGLPPGRWTVTATRDATSQEIRQTIEVAEGASEIVIDLDFTNVPLPTEETSEP